MSMLSENFIFTTPFIAIESTEGNNLFANVSLSWILELLFIISRSYYSWVVEAWSTLSVPGVAVDIFELMLLAVAFVLFIDVL
jgi:hypothetical protein